jgi:hypothetical protein
MLAEIFIFVWRPTLGLLRVPFKPENRFELIKKRSPK